MNKKCSHEGGKYIYFAEMINKWCLEFYGSGNSIFIAGIVKKIGKIRWENTFKMQNCFLNGVEIKMLHFICKYVCKM